MHLCSHSRSGAQDWFLSYRFFLCFLVGGQVLFLNLPIRHLLVILFVVTTFLILRGSPQRRMPPLACRQRKPLPLHLGTDRRAVSQQIRMESLLPPTPAQLCPSFPFDLALVLSPSRAS